MTQLSTLSSTGEQLILSLHNKPHHVCVAATQAMYWQQFTENSTISIKASGKYVPSELAWICSDEEEPRLHLILRAQCEADIQLLGDIYCQIIYDLLRFEGHDHATYDWVKQEVIVFGSLFNSLPSTIFETDRHLLGQRNCNIKKIRNILGCSIDVDQPMTQRYRFRIRHVNRTVMDVAAIQIQALVRQAQDQYLIAFAMSIGRTLVDPTERIGTSTSTSVNPPNYPLFTSFQSNNKRVCQTNDDSDDSADETTYDETR
ncbi:unnamed protein product, partial [Adineta steineri]